MTDRPDIPGLRSVEATNASNPAWYALAIVGGLVIFFSALTRIPAGMGLFSAIMIFLVLPFGIPVALVAFLTWYTDWRTTDQRITKTRFGRDRSMSWSEVESARMLANGSTELVAGERRLVIPRGDLTLTASVWQHLREKKGLELPEAIAQIWDPVPDGLPEEFAWENPRRVGFWQTHGWEVARVVVGLAYLGMLYWKRKWIRNGPYEDLFNPLWAVVIMNTLGRSKIIAKRVTAGPAEVVTEYDRSRTSHSWHSVRVRVTRRAVMLDVFPTVTVPLDSASDESVRLIAVIRKHLREQAKPVLFVIHRN